RLFRIQQPAHFLQRGIGAEAMRLVENQYTVDLAAYAFDLSHALFPVLGVLAILGYRTLDQHRQFSTTTNARIIVEAQLRHAAQLHRLAQQHTQVASRVVEDVQVQLELFVVKITHQGDENLCMPDIAANFHRRDGHEPESRVANLAGNHLRQLALHLVADALGATVFFSHKNLPQAASARLEKP